MKINTLFILALIFISNLTAWSQVPADLPQLLSGKAVCIDPGHGGHESDDRRTEVGYGIIYWESEGNFQTANHLFNNLQALGCDVSITRTTNDDDSNEGDPSLDDRVAFSEALGGDYFHSIHTNGASNQSANYHLQLYASLNASNRDVAQFPLAKEMAYIMADDLPEVVYTTSTSVYADLVFQPTWTSGYGILNGQTVPATISEASFHSNPPEGRRLNGAHYQRAMAMQMTKSYLSLWQKGSLPYGEIGGILTGKNGVEACNVDVELFRNGTLVDQVQTDGLVNGFYYFQWLEAGEYELKFYYKSQYLDTQTVTVTEGEYNRFDLNLDVSTSIPDYLYKPEKVKMNYATINANGNPEVSWDTPGITPTGYRLYYASDDNLSEWKLAADENTLTGSVNKIEFTSNEDYIDTPVGEVNHFYVIALVKVGDDQELGDPGKVYSVKKLNGSRKLLIVDGFDRNTAVNESNDHKLSAKYIAALKSNPDISEISTADNSMVVSGDIILNNYDLVIWISGEESTADVTFSPDEQAKVKSYLENGGKFIVSGAEIGWDLVNKGDNNDKAFYSNYLKAEYKSDGNNNYGTAVGESGSFYFENLNIEFNGADGWTVKYPDGILPANGSESLMYYSNGDGNSAAVAYKGTFGSSANESAGLVYFSFPIAASKLIDTQNILNRSIEYLFGDPLSEDDHKLADFKTYPNPVNDQLTVSGLLIGQKYTIEIYNITGTLIFSENISSYSGEYNINTSDWSNGIYLLKAISGSAALTKKIFK